MAATIIPATERTASANGFGSRQRAAGLRNAGFLIPGDNMVSGYEAFIESKSQGEEEKKQKSLFEEED